ncbi:MAG: hypothetical protein ACFBZ8_09060 [Opitutales bacterium]
MKRPSLLLSASVATLALWVPAGAFAEALNVGSGTPAANANPFDRTLSGVRYQQSFLSSSFGTEPLMFEAVAFEPLFLQDGFDIGTREVTQSLFYQADVTLRLGIGLDPQDLQTDLEQNFLQTPQTVFQESNFSGLLEAGSFSLSFVLDDPFAYDPAEGSLLLEIEIANQDTEYRSQSDRLFFRSVAGSEDTARIWEIGDEIFTDGSNRSGLQVAFVPSSTVIPESAAYAWAALGVVALLALRRSRVQHSCAPQHLS